MLDKQQFIAATGLGVDSADKWFKPITDAMAEFAISLPLSQAHFLAQVGHESAGFSILLESFNYSVEGLTIFGSRLTQEQRRLLGRQPGEPVVPVEKQQAIANLVYGGRHGNVKPDDGWFYRGRGLLQLTFRNNYFLCGEALALTLIEEPDHLLDATTAARAAGWFWQHNDCNDIALKDDVTALTLRINGGHNGLNDRKLRADQAKFALL